MVLVPAAAKQTLDLVHGQEAGRCFYENKDREVDRDQGAGRDQIVGRGRVAGKVDLALQHLRCSCSTHNPEALRKIIELQINYKHIILNQHDTWQEDFMV